MPQSAHSERVALGNSSHWTLTDDARVTTLVDDDAAFSNIASGGHDVCYTADVNGAADAIYMLNGGGSLAPCP